jgi:hypothetical protein
MGGLFLHDVYIMFQLFQKCGGGGQIQVEQTCGHDTISLYKTKHEGEKDYF